jgi:hypothetical protein
MHNDIFFYTSGRQKLFSNEEKILLNKRVPDLETATSVRNLYLEKFSCCRVINNVLLNHENHRDFYVQILPLHLSVC